MTFKQRLAAVQYYVAHYLKLHADMNQVAIDLNVSLATEAYKSNPSSAWRAIQAGIRSV